MKDNAKPAGSSVSLPRMVLIIVSAYAPQNAQKNNHAYISRKLCEISTAIFESCGANYRRICKMFSALQSTSGPVTYFENSVHIDA